MSTVQEWYVPLRSQMPDQEPLACFDRGTRANRVDGWSRIRTSTDGTMLPSPLINNVALQYIGCPSKAIMASISITLQTYWSRVSSQRALIDRSNSMLLMLKMSLNGHDMTCCGPLKFRRSEQISASSRRHSHIDVRLLSWQERPEADRS